MCEKHVWSCRTDCASVSAVCCLLSPRGQRWQADWSTSQGQVYLREPGSNVSAGPAAVGDKPVSIKSIVMITTEIKQPTWHRLSIPQTAAFGVPIMSVRAEGWARWGGTLILMMFHQSVWSFFFFFSWSLFSLAVLLLGLQKLFSLGEYFAVLSVLEPG